MVYYGIYVEVIMLHIILKKMFISFRKINKCSYHFEGKERYSAQNSWDFWGDKKSNSVDSWHSILFYLLVKMELIVEQLEAAETADSPDSTEFAGADVGVVSDMAEGNEYVPSMLVAQADAIFTEASAFREKDYGKIPEEDMLLDEIYTLNSFIHKDYIRIR